MALTDYLSGIADAIREKKQSAAMIPAQNFAQEIRGIQGGGGTTPPSPDTWERPADRPAVPAIGEDEQVMYMLYGVQATGPNDHAIRLTTSAGQYRAEWGDGTQDDCDSNTTAEHMYDYAAIPGTPNAQGYKWVWIKMYPLAGDLTQMNPSVRHSARPAGSSSNIFCPQVFEWYMRAPYFTALSFTSATYTRYTLLDVFDFRGANKIASFTYFLRGSANLKKLAIDTSSGTTFSYFMYGCSGFNGTLDIDTGKGTIFGGFMNGSTSFNQPLTLNTSKGTDFNSFLASCSSFNQRLTIDTSGGKNFNSFMSGCSSFNQPLTIDTSAGTTMGSFLNGCTSFNQPLTIDTSLCTSYSMFMSGCSSFNQPLNIDTSAGTVFSSFMATCSALNQTVTVDLASATTAIGTSFIGSSAFALKGLRLLNMGTVHTALAILYTDLDVPALVALFGDLADRTATTAGTITITGAYGAARLTPEQRAIATDKNWTITG